MAISKIIYKSSAEATPEVWMDATTATAAAANIIAPYTAMLADGIVTTGTGSGGGGGLEYETGTWTPASDVGKGEISFANSHTNKPIMIFLSDSKGTYSDTTNSNYSFVFSDYYNMTGVPIYVSSSTERYSSYTYQYRGTNTSSLTISTANQNSSNSDEIVTNTKFYPYTASSSRYWRSGRTYKWIAVWKPST